MIKRLSLVLAVVLASVGSPALSGAAPGGAKAEKPAWPAHVQVVEARMLMPEMGEGFRFALPQFRAYDPQGRQLYSSEGYDLDDFKRQATRLLKGKGKPRAGAAALAADLAKVETPAGQPLPPLPPADLTLIEYWAEWCVPCHAQTRDLVQVLAKHPEVKVNLVYVDADFTKRFPKKTS
jgi:thiol-disulfide isomerase/thioredoxin